MSFTAAQARSIIRKAVKRVPEGEEITHLNIMPMMDMMTILLVAFIFQAAVSATQLSAGAVTLPRSLSDEPLPEGAFTVIITKTGIVVDGKPVVAVKDGNIDASDLEGGSMGYNIPKLASFLSALRQEELRTKVPGELPAVPELLIIADRTTPFLLLTRVLFSAKQKEAGYRRFRLIVQKHYAPTK
ncbi:MAG: biopolymer transporter ExbD [Myxococcales bacterium]|jgi:biopolymer transport protein ExbD|nr:biopolymer transporter ExbD [Myxococcales bacterium]HRC57060.1 biopolymer transporter ExbD [Kofleriaceae bacterium]